MDRFFIILFIRLDVYELKLNILCPQLWLLIDEHIWISSTYWDVVFLFAFPDLRKCVATDLK